MYGSESQWGSRKTTKGTWRMKPCDVSTNMKKEGWTGVNLSWCWYWLINAVLGFFFINQVWFENWSPTKRKTYCECRMGKQSHFFPNGICPQMRQVRGIFDDGEELFLKSRLAAPAANQLATRWLRFFLTLFGSFLKWHQMTSLKPTGKTFVYIYFSKCYPFQITYINTRCCSFSPMYWFLWCLAKLCWVSPSMLSRNCRVCCMPLPLVMKPRHLGTLSKWQGGYCVFLGAGSWRIKVVLFRIWNISP